MKIRSLKGPLAIAITGGIAGGASATTVLNVDYVPTTSGTNITIGSNTSPQYTFLSSDQLGGKTSLQANDGATVAFPYNGVMQPNLSSVVTSFAGGALFTDGDYQLAFDIGSTAYTGLATVTGEGNEITKISYNAVSSVPEPATWALMVLGLGAAGGALRRQRAGHSAAVAIA